MEGRPVEEETFSQEVEMELTRVKHAITRDRIEIPESFYESADGRDQECIPIYTQITSLKNAASS